MPLRHGNPFLRRTLILATLLISGAGVTPSLTAQQAAPSPRDSLTLEFDESASDQLRRLQTLISAGDWDRARAVWRQLQRQPPETLVQVDSRRTLRAPLLADELLRQLPKLADPLTHSDHEPAATPPATTAETGAVETRTARAGTAVTVGELRWRHSAHDPFPAHQVSVAATGRHVESPIVPLVFADHVYFAENDAIRGIKPDDGTPIWPVNDGRQRDAVYGDPLDSDYPYQLPYRGMLRRSLTAADGRLFGFIGAPFAITAAQEPRTVETRIVCLDIESQEGKLLWWRSPTAAIAEPHWRASGPPVATETHLYIPVRRYRAPMAIGLLALDARDGSTLWFRSVAGLRQTPTLSQHVVTGDAITLTAEGLFLAGDFGGAARLDAATGQVDWVRRDDAIPTTSTPFDPASEHPARAALLTGTTLLTIAQDDQSVQALDSRTGERFWVTPCAGELRQFVGIVDDLAIVAGDQITALRTTTGEIHWSIDARQLGHPLVGQATIIGQTLFACTTTDLWQIELPTGQANRAVSLETNHLTGGHLTSTNDRLLITTPHEIAAFEIHRPPQSK